MRVVSAEPERERFAPEPDLDWMLALEGERERPGEDAFEERRVPVGVGGATFTGSLPDGDVADVAESGGGGDAGDAGDTILSSASVGGSAKDGMGGGLNEPSSFSAGGSTNLGIGSGA